MTLMGSEAVSGAGHNMCSAAAEMKQAATWIEESLSRHRLEMNNWLDRFEQILKDYNDKQK